jgi:diacylglycerol kinase (ATP)
MMPGRPRTGRLLRLLLAARYTLAGLGHALRAERPFQEEVLCLVLIAIPGAIWLGTDKIERALMVGSWLLVLVVELLNAAIERTVDRIGLERHELSGRAKDLGSAAVGVAIALALVVWGLIIFG